MVMPVMARLIPSEKHPIHRQRVFQKRPFSCRIFSSMDIVTVMRVMID
jgi:hypothetical protein